MPSFVQSIRFRLSLTFALVVFSVGSFLVGGLYVWQVNQLEQPVLQTRRLVFEDARTGERFESDMRVYTREEANLAFVQALEVEAERQALVELRKASFGALTVLFVASFGSGYLLAGWALRPVSRISGVAKDITATDLSRRISLKGPDDELKNMADTFDDMLDRLQGAFEDQRRFVHEASHELRNPLAVAQTNLELALDGGDKEELTKGAEIALRSTGRMQVLVEDLLEQARQGVPELNRQQIDMNRLAADAATEFAAAAGKRHLSIATELAAAEVLVNGDGPALRRALSNLLANAVRLAPEGSTIGLRTAMADDCVLLSVSDEGPGIAPSDHDSIFQRFWRGQDAGSGSGLGLSIVRQIAERHGGQVLLDSDAGRGSTFTLRLPTPVA